jgi:hypothetical protein
MAPTRLHTPMEDESASPTQGPSGTTTTTTTSSTGGGVVSAPVPPAGGTRTNPAENIAQVRGSSFSCRRLQKCQAAPLLPWQKKHITRARPVMLPTASVGGASAATAGAQEGASSCRSERSSGNGAMHKRAWPSCGNLPLLACHRSPSPRPVCLIAISARVRP